METLDQYFQRTDTPSANSPVGNLMARILAKFPESSFADARTKAHELLGQAAGRRKYQTPAVLSPEEQERRRAVFDDFKRARPDVSGLDVPTQAVI